MASCIGAWSSDLHDCKNLRNLLVHTARYPHEAYAEPSDWGLQRFRDIVDQVVHPVRLVPTFQRDLRVFRPEQPLPEALRHMDEKDYSQVVVKVDGGRHALLSLEGVARWLAGTSKDGVAQLGAATVAEALAYEPHGTHIFLPRDATLEEARKAFEVARRERKRARVYAAIITESGVDTEAPHGHSDRRRPSGRRERLIGGRGRLGCDERCGAGPVRGCAPAPRVHRLCRPAGATAAAIRRRAPLAGRHAALRPAGSPPGTRCGHASGGCSASGDAGRALPARPSGSRTTQVTGSGEELRALCHGASSR